MTDADEKLLVDGRKLIRRGLELKDQPRDLRLILVEIQALRFDIGQAYAIAAGDARSAFREVYWENKTVKMLSPNAAYKQAETDEAVVEAKNRRDILETAYNVMSDFVSTNQTSLRIATEEAKNTL